MSIFIVFLIIETLFPKLKDKENTDYAALNASGCVMVFEVAMQWNIQFSDYAVVLTVFKYKRLSSVLQWYLVSNRLVHSTTFRTNGLIL